MTASLWIAQIVLALIYAMAGALHAFRTPNARARSAWAKRHSERFVRFIGAVELLGALGLVLPVLSGILPWLTPLAALGLVLLQALAILVEHLPAHERRISFNLFLLVLAAFVVYGRVFGLPD